MPAGKQRRPNSQLRWLSRPVVVLTVLAAGSAGTLAATPATAVAASTDPVTTQYSPTLMSGGWQGTVGHLQTDDTGDVAVWATTSEADGNQVRVVGAGIDDTFGGTAVDESWQMPTTDLQGTVLASLVTPDDGPGQADVVTLTSDDPTPKVVPLPAGASALSVTEAPDGVDTAVVYRADDASTHLAVWNGTALDDTTPAGWATSPPVLDGGKLPVEVAVGPGATEMAYFVDGDPNGVADPSLHDGCRPHLVVTDGEVSDTDVGTDALGNQLPVTCAASYGEEVRPQLSWEGTPRLFFTVQATDQQPSDTDPVGGSWIDAKFISTTSPPTPPQTGPIYRITPSPSLDPGATPTTMTSPLLTGISADGNIVTYEDLDLFEPYLTGSGQAAVPTGWTRDISQCLLDCADTLDGLSRVITDTDGRRAWNGLPATPDGTVTAMTVSIDGTTDVFAAADPGVTEAPVDTPPDPTQEEVYRTDPASVIALGPLGDVALTASGDGTGTGTVDVSATGLSGVARVSVSEAGKTVGQADLTVSSDGTGTAQVAVTGAIAGTLTAELTDRDGRTATATSQATLPTPAPPGPVTAIHFEGGGLGTTTIAWVDPTGATGTRVRIRGGIGAGHYDRTWALGAGVARLHASGLPTTSMGVGHPYHVSITALGDGGASSISTMALAPSTALLSTTRAGRHGRVRLRLVVQTGSSRSPAHARVALQGRRAGGAWTHLRYVQLSGTGGRSVTFHVRHRELLRVRYDGRGGVLGSYSTAVRVHP